MGLSDNYRLASISMCDNHGAIDAQCALTFCSFDTKDFLHGRDRTELRHKPCTLFRTGAATFSGCVKMYFVQS